MKILTFIIPSYNVERYLRKGLESYYVPELAEQIEVIVVDDGSSDHTAEIAKSYIEKCPDIYRLIQKKNGGHGSTINVGSLEAKGKYFKVIDADDWIVTENLKNYVQYLEKTDADVVLTPFHMVDMKTGDRTLQTMYIDDYERYYTPDEIAADWKSFDRCTTFHGVAYKTSFYNKYRHELPEKVFYEDQEYATVPFCHAQKVAVQDLYIYQYLIGNSEQSVSDTNKIKRIGHLEAVILNMLSFWEKNKHTVSFSRNYFLKKMESIVLSYYVIMCLITPRKKEGRIRCKQLNSIIRNKCSELSKSLNRKYYLYLIFSMLHINEAIYQRIIHSALFRFVCRSHKVEQE